MEDILDQLNRVRGVGGSLLLSADGLVVASRLRSDADEESLTAAVAELMGHVDRLLAGMTLGSPRLVHCQGPQGGVALLACGPGFLALIIDPHANLALLQLETRPFVDALTAKLAL